jgi:hypothetical protein
MVLLYTHTSELDFARDIAAQLREAGEQVAFHAARYWAGEILPCERVVCTPRAAHVAAAYSAAGIPAEVIGHSGGAAPASETSNTPPIAAAPSDSACTTTLEQVEQRSGYRPRRQRKDS